MQWNEYSILSYSLLQIASLLVLLRCYSYNALHLRGVREHIGNYRDGNLGSKNRNLYADNDTKIKATNWIEQFYN